ncbi:MAG: hypothetical protein QOF81_1754, partial [Acidimicrobiaceae bacterium]|nr:hypothetical protein [Acidimicrobiaceae bacterium]
PHSGPSEEGAGQASAPEERGHCFALYRTIGSRDHPPGVRSATSGARA